MVRHPTDHVEVFEMDEQLVTSRMLHNLAAKRV